MIISHFHTRTHTHTHTPTHPPTHTLSLTHTHTHTSKTTYTPSHTTSHSRPTLLNSWTLRSNGCLQQLALPSSCNEIRTIRQQVPLAARCASIQRERERERETPAKYTRKCSTPISGIRYTRRQQNVKIRLQRVHLAGTRRATHRIALTMVQLKMQLEKTRFRDAAVEMRKR